jgi:hypothetical protein
MRTSRRVSKHGLSDSAKAYEHDRHDRRATVPVCSGGQSREARRRRHPKAAARSRCLRATRALNLPSRRSVGAALGCHACMALPSSPPAHTKRSRPRPNRSCRGVFMPPPGCRPAASASTWPPWCSCAARCGGGWGPARQRAGPRAAAGGGPGTAAAAPAAAVVDRVRVSRLPQMHTHTHTRTGTGTCTCTCTHTRTHHTRTHTYTRTHTHARTTQHTTHARTRRRATASSPAAGRAS